MDNSLAPHFSWRLLWSRRQQDSSSGSDNIVLFINYYYLGFIPFKWRQKDIKFWTSIFHNLTLDSLKDFFPKENSLYYIYKLYFYLSKYFFFFLGSIDLKTPDSLLVDMKLRSLLNYDSFNSLSQLDQNKLLQLLPEVDRIASDGSFKYIFILFSLIII